MAGVLDKLKSKMESEQQAAATEWDALVEKLARDEGSEKEVAAVLKAAGRSLDELQTDVDRAKRIQFLRGEIAKYPTALADQRKAMQRLADFRSEKEATQKALDVELWRVRGENNAASQRVERLRGLASELEKLTGAPVVLSAVAEVDAVIIKPATNEVELPPAAANEVRLPSDA